MKMKWPENYQERIETIIGAKYDETRHVYFLGFDFKTVREAKDCITKIQLMQKQLRQLKTEINNKIKVVKAQRMPRARKKDGGLLVFASLLSDFTSGRKITDYQYVMALVHEYFSYHSAPIFSKILTGLSHKQPRKLPKRSLILGLQLQKADLCTKAIRYS